MAKQTSVIQFTGRLGNMIGYYHKGEHFLRSTPDKIRQTTATQRAAQRFGMASKKGAFIRHTLYSALDVHCDSTHVNRLTKTLIPAAGNNIRSLKGFRFNQSAGTDHFFTIAPFLSADNVLHIPAQTLIQYKSITALEVKMIATRIDLNTHHTVDIQTSMVTIDPAASFEGIMLPVDVPGTGTLVITLQVRAMQGNKISANKKHLAADIIAIQPPQPQVIVQISSKTYATITQQIIHANLYTVYHQLQNNFIKRE